MMHWFGGQQASTIYAANMEVDFDIIVSAKLQVSDSSKRRVMAA